MGDIYVEVDDDFRVTKIHRMPFDPNNGMGYTREELENRGYFVKEIPEPVHQTGRRSIAMYNPDTKSIYYEQVGIPMSDKERVEYLENALNSLLTLTLSQQYASEPVALMSLDEDTSVNDEDSEVDGEEESTNEIDQNIGEYLAYQIISGKIDVTECFDKFPQYQSIIKEVLLDNGIQA